MGKVREYVALKVAKRKLDAQLSAVNGQLAALQEMLLDQFADGGVSQTKLEDGTTLYINPQVRAKIKEGHQEALVDALRASGLKEFISVNTNSISSLVRDTLKLAGVMGDGIDTKMIDFDEVDFAKVAPEWGEHVQVGCAMTLNVLGAKSKE
jgi:hypothetical protein